MAVMAEAPPFPYAEASLRARVLLRSGWPETIRDQAPIAEFDYWLRADGNRRNPGTTADLVAACLFAALRERLISIPDWVRLD